MTILAEYIAKEPIASPNIVEIIEHACLSRWMVTIPSPEEIGGYQWLSDRGEYQGTLPKRMAKWAAKQGRIINDYEQSNFGNEIRPYMMSVGEKIVLTDDLYWKAGDFKDGQSCFWKSASIAKDYLSRAGGQAIQAFQLSDELEWRGTGRCWIIAPNKRDLLYPRIPSDHRTMVMFNAYGKSLNWFVNFYHLVLPNYAGRCQKVFLDGAGALYINNEEGYLMGTHRTVQNVTLNTAIDTAHCEECDKWYDEDDFCSDEEGEGVMCSKCFRQRLREREEDQAREDAFEAQREREAEEEMENDRIAEQILEQEELEEIYAQTEERNNGD